MDTETMQAGLDVRRALFGPEHAERALERVVTKDELREVLLHSMVYCGVPAGVSAFRQAAEVLRDTGLEPAVQS